MYMIRILNFQNQFSLSFAAPNVSLQNIENKCRGKKINAEGKHFLGILFYVCCSYVKNTHCDGFIQIEDSLPF